MLIEICRRRIDCPKISLRLREAGSRSFYILPVLPDGCMGLGEKITGHDCSLPPFLDLVC